eukprot:Seg1882.12 transcript_id=Seg1882.12/GoldUCD/mRNA.D3Y31 product="Monoacylglycerol lipase ABHD12" protein_id=Seg1882.12/GoldUCD/D3Y31
MADADDVKGSAENTVSSVRTWITSSLKYSVATIISVYVFFGSLMCISKDFRNVVLFLHVVNVPLFANFSKPDSFGLENTKNFYLDGDAGKIGAWFVESKAVMSKGYVLYLHGNGGTRVAVQLARLLCQDDAPPDGLVLEAPFSNVYDAAMSHPFSKPYSLLPFYEDLMVKELKNAFRNDYWIQNVTSPILIMHDKSDNIVPFTLGQKLCLAAKEYSLDVECIYLDEQLSHKFIYKSKRLEEIITNFEKRVESRRR